MARGKRSKGNFTSLQREACYRLVAVEGRTAADARELLQTYGLGPVEPFEISLDSVRRVAREVGKSRSIKEARDQAFADPDESLTDLFRQGVRLARGELQRMRADQDKGRAIDPKTFTQWVIALRELRKDAASIPRTPPKPTGEETPADPAPTPGSLLERLEGAEEHPAESPLPPVADRTLPTTTSETVPNPPIQDAETATDGTTTGPPIKSIDRESTGLEVVPA